MNTQQVLESYQKIQSNLSGGEKLLPALNKRTYGLKVKSDPLQNIEQVKEQLKIFNPKEGWLAYQSRNIYFRDGTISEKPEYGVLMNAEMVNADKTSLHLRYDGRDQWIITRYEYTEGNDYIADDIKHIATDDKLESLIYKRFWHIDDIQGCEPVAACFCGFGG